MADQATNETVVEGAQAPFADRPADKPLVSTLPGSVQDDWTIEYHWSHDVPRGGGTRMLRFQSDGRWTESSSMAIGGEPIERSYTVDAARVVNGLAAAIDAVERFSFENARYGEVDDVPNVQLQIRSGGGELSIEFDNWYAAQPAIASAIQRFLGQKELLPGTPPVERKVQQLEPKPGTRWRLAMSLRDDLRRSVEWTINETGSLDVHGELSDEIIGWYSATMDNAEVEQLLQTASRMLHEFRFRPRGDRDSQPVTVGLAISAGGFTFRMGETYPSPEAVAVSGFGTLIKIIARGHRAGFEDRLPGELLQE